MLGDYRVDELGGSESFSAFAAFGPDHEPAIPEPAPEGRRRFRTIWISDIHLGTRGCNAELLIDFLDSVDSETMYLVGDIIDGWRLKKKFYWPQAHNDIVWRILKRPFLKSCCASPGPTRPASSSSIPAGCGEIPPPGARASTNA